MSQINNIAKHDKATRISVLGAGSWGSALAIAFSHVAQLTIWGRNQQQIDSINNCRINSGYLPEEVRFRDNINATTDLDFALSACDLLVIATPLSGLRQML